MFLCVACDLKNKFTDLFEPIIFVSFFLASLVSRDAADLSAVALAKEGGEAQSESPLVAVGRWNHRDSTGQGKTRRRRRGQACSLGVESSKRYFSWLHGGSGGVCKTTPLDAGTHSAPTMHLLRKLATKGRQDN
jgi:hypothetical protein